jgi:uncharacterized integral membrane protein
MMALDTTRRWPWAAGAALAVLLPCVVILFQGWLPPAVILGACLAYAAALWPTYYLDHWLGSGAGFHSWAAFLLLATNVAILAWPLVLLGLRPGLRHRPAWRKAISAYAVVLLLVVAVAAWQMTLNGHLFFG